MVWQRHVQGMNSCLGISHTFALPTGNIVNLALERYLRGTQISQKENARESLSASHSEEKAQVIDFYKHVESLKRSRTEREDRGILALLNALKKDS